MVYQRVSDQVKVFVRKAQYFTLFVANFGRAAFRAVFQSELVNPGDTGDPPSETHGHGVAVASGFHVGRGTQLFEHLNLAPYAALFAAQVSLFPWRELAAIRVLLCQYPFLLAAPQFLADGAGELITGAWLELLQQAGRPGLQGFQLTCHQALPIRWHCPGNLAPNSDRGNPPFAAARRHASRLCCLEHPCLPPPALSGAV